MHQDSLLKRDLRIAMHDSARLPQGWARMTVMTHHIFKPNLTKTRSTRADATHLVQFSCWLHEWSVIVTSVKLCSVLWRARRVIQTWAFSLRKKLMTASYWRGSIQWSLDEPLPNSSSCIKLTTFISRQLKGLQLFWAVDRSIWSWLVSSWWSKHHSLWTKSRLIGNAPQLLWKINTALWTHNHMCNWEPAWFGQNSCICNSVLCNVCICQANMFLQNW